MRSKVHAQYKTKDRVGNWSAYEQALVQRGDVTLWLSADATDAWRPAPSGRPGAPKTFSDCAIETALTLRLVFRVPLRHAEGFWRSVLSLMGGDLAAPDPTTLSRRSQSLAVAFRRIPSRGPIHRIVDSTGRSIVGEGEWAAVNHGGRGHRGWQTRHLAVDRGGAIVAHALTEPTVDAATISIDLMETVDDEIARVTADAAYETVAFYAAAEMRDATVVVPPSKTARMSRRRPRSRARDRTITDVRTLGRRCCMKDLLRVGRFARPSRLRRSHTAGMQSKVHPTYKTKYRVANWPAYNQALVRRGDVMVWLSSEAIAAWTPRRSGRRGGQRRYSDLAIETAMTLRLLYHLPLRQAEGFLHALFRMMRLDLSVPDYTTLSRRSQHLTRRLRPVPSGEGLHLVLDSTGLSIVGAGEWAAAKHGGRGRRGWRKLHLGVDQSGVILVHTLTEATGDDATTALDLLNAVDGPLVRVTADAAYDTVAVYETATARGATVIIPPAKTANISGHGPRSPARDRTVTLVKQLGRRRWKKVSGYHRQGRVENTFFRYKSIIGDGLRARSPAGQGSEAVLGCEILNRMTALGRPVSYRIGR